MPERIISINEIVNAEMGFEPGKVPEPVWLEHLRLHGVATIEVAPYKWVYGKLLVFMQRRPPTDRDYPNQLHMPGTMVNGNDKTEQDAIKRVKEKEMHGFVFGQEDKITSFIRKTPRGTEAVFLYTIPVYQGGDTENWYDVKNIPNETIEHHKKMIEIVSQVISALGHRRQTVAFE